MNAEAKSVLDSWVRHEQQVRESEQAQLVKTIQTNVLKSINDPKFKKDLIASALTDIESEFGRATFSERGGGGREERREMEGWVLGKGGERFGDR